MAGNKTMDFCKNKNRAISELFPDSSGFGFQEQLFVKRQKIQF
jgi:hypothetical protein